MLNRIVMFALLALVPLAQAQTPFECSASDPHREFDFWIGKWSVSDASGKLQGHNEIRKVQKGCVLEEQWTSVRGGSGQSMNYYHPGRKEWRQLWLDGGASIIDIQGGLEDGSMVLTGTIFYLAQSAEKPFRGKWTLLEDGRVRQFFEQQDEAGQWQVWFEGFYQKEQ